MRNAFYDPAKDSIILEPGIHWQEAVTVLEPYGVAPVGGKFVPLFVYLLHAYRANSGRVG
jgi:hypothetical protein